MLAIIVMLSDIPMYIKAVFEKIFSVFSAE